jgi:hypothetical protein
MRGAFLLTMVLVGSVILAGCSDGDGDGTTSTTTKSGTTSKVTMTRTVTETNTTSLPPNLPPVLVLNVKDAGGNSTNATTVGGTLTFDATGSRDQDADGLYSIAIVVQDTNRTYPPGALFGGGQFLSATYTFDRAGPVNVTVSALDVRGDRTELRTHVFINEVTTGGQGFDFSVPLAAAEDAADCAGPSGQGALDNALYNKINFNVQAGVQYVVATIVGGDGEIAICAPDGTAISPSGSDSVTSNKGTVFAVPAGAASYYVGVYGGAANAAVTVQVVVHYDPQP